MRPAYPGPDRPTSPSPGRAVPFVRAYLRHPQRVRCGWPRRTLTDAATGVFDTTATAGWLPQCGHRAKPDRTRTVPRWPARTAGCSPGRGVRPDPGGSGVANRSAAVTPRRGSAAYPMSRRAAPAEYRAWRDARSTGLLPGSLPYGRAAQRRRAPGRRRMRRWPSGQRPQAGPAVGAAGVLPACSAAIRRRSRAGNGPANSPGRPGRAAARLRPGPSLNAASAS